MNEIGYLIRSRRKELGLTLEEVGNAVGVSKSTVKKWEDGYISNMRRDKIENLARVLEINPVRLLGIKVTHMLQPDDPQFMKLLTLYHSLNDIGKEKAIERIEELAEVERYTRKEGDNYGAI